MINFAVRTRQDENNLQALQNQLDLKELQEAYQLEVQQTLQAEDAREYNSVQERVEGSVQALAPLATPYLNRLADPAAIKQFQGLTNSTLNAGKEHAQATGSKIYTQKYVANLVQLNNEQRALVYDDPSKFVTVSSIEPDPDAAGIVPTTVLAEVQKDRLHGLAASAIAGRVERMFASSDPVTDGMLLVEALRKNDTESLPELAYLERDEAEALSTKIQSQVLRIQEETNRAELEALKTELESGIELSLGTGNNSGLNIEKIKEYAARGGDPEVVEEAQYALTHSGQISGAIQAAQSMARPQWDAFVETFNPYTNPALQNPKDFAKNVKLYNHIKAVGNAKQEQIAKDPTAVFTGTDLDNYYAATGVNLEDRTTLGKPQIAELAKQIMPTQGTKADPSKIFAFMENNKSLTGADITQVFKVANLSTADLNAGITYGALASDENRDYLRKVMLFDKGTVSSALQPMFNAALSAALNNSEVLKATTAYVVGDRNNTDTRNLLGTTVDLVKQATLLEIAADPTLVNNPGKALNSALAKLIPNPPVKVGGGYAMVSESVAKSFNNHLQQIASNPSKYHIGNPSAKTPPPAKFLNPISAKSTMQQREDHVLPMIQYAAGLVGLPPGLLYGTLRQESSFSHFDASGKVITSSTGAKGIGQFQPSTYAGIYKQYGKKYGLSPSPTDYRSNIIASALLLKGNLDVYKGNAQLAMAAYNGGGDGVTFARSNFNPATGAAISAKRKASGSYFDGSQVQGYIQNVTANMQKFQAKAPLDYVEPLANVNARLGGNLHQNMVLQTVKGNLNEFAVYVRERTTAGAIRLAPLYRTDGKHVILRNLGN
jgi:soluble lytic murein transglycosylase-like protein